MLNIVIGKAYLCCKFIHILDIFISIITAEKLSETFSIFDHSYRTLIFPDYRMPAYAFLQAMRNENICFQFPPHSKTTLITSSMPLILLKNILSRSVISEATTCG